MIPSQIQSRFLCRVELPQRKRKHMPTCISLFSGCGGMDIGFSQGGFEIRVMVEWEKASCNTLRTNWTMEGHRRSIDNMIATVRKTGVGVTKRHGWGVNSKKKKDIEEVVQELLQWRERGPRSHKVKGGWYREREPAILERDITTLPTSEILEAADLQVGEADVVTGGFPCQGFSTVRGKRYIDDPRNRLYKECVRVVREALPRMFVFENVPGLASMDQGRVIRQICDDLKDSGYNMRWDILNAADYGVPQNRKRIFFIGERIDLMAMDAAKPKGVPRLHLAAIQGRMQYPEWFIAKYPQSLPLGI